MIVWGLASGGPVWQMQWVAERQTAQRWLQLRLDQASGLLTASGRTTRGQSVFPPQHRTGTRVEAGSNIALCSGTADSPSPSQGLHIKDTFEGHIALHQNCQKLREMGACLR